MDIENFTPLKKPTKNSLDRYKKPDILTTIQTEYTGGDLFSHYILNKATITILPIISFLEYTDLINLRMCSKQLKNTLNKKMIKKYVRNGGISNITRKLFWKANLDYSA